MDKLDGVDVEFCAELNRFLVEQLDAQGIEDYALEIGSVSLTANKNAVSKAFGTRCRGVGG